MTEPDEHLPYAGTAEPSTEKDPERLEAIAEKMPVDPSPQQVDSYRTALGDDGLPEHA